MSDTNEDYQPGDGDLQGDLLGGGPPPLIGISPAATASSETLIAMLQEQQRMMLQQQQDQQRFMRDLLERQKEEHRREIQELRARGEAGERVKLPKPTLQKFQPTDDIENFLATFERVAKQQKWPKEVWATQLAGLLTGKAMAAYIVQ